MTRSLYPVEDDRRIEVAPGIPAPPGAVVSVWLDAAATIAADVRLAPDGSRSPLTVDEASRVPLLLGPDGTAADLWATVAAGQPRRLRARSSPPGSELAADPRAGGAPAVGIPTLATTAVLVDRGLWAPNTTYAVGDVVGLFGTRWYVSAPYTSTTFPATGNLIALGPRQWLNAKDYGAQGDAATDDTVAIQNAIDAAAASAASTGNGGSVFLPAGYYVISSTLVLKKHVWLRGEGMIATVIKLAVNANCHVVQNQVATTAAGANADYVGLVDLSLDGNSAHQNGAGPYYGVRFETNPPTSAATGDSFFDMHHVVQNVRVYKAKGDGFHFVGRSAIQVVNAFSNACAGYGFSSTFDTNFTHCESDSSGRAGFYLNNGSIRLSVCKSYLSGAIDGVGAGFRMDSNASGISMSACEAQNNQGQGFLMNGCGRVTLAGCTADSNNMAGGSYVGFDLYGATFCTITGTAWQGKQGGTQVGHQSNAFRLAAGANENFLAITHSAGGGALIGPAASPDTTYSTSNVVFVNGQAVNPAYENSANKGVPGGYASLNSTGLVPAAQLPVPGPAFGDGFFGDGSDGNVTLDGAITVPWATRSGAIYQLTRQVFADTLTINAGVTLQPKGFHVYAKTRITGAGTIAINGANATSSNGAPGASVSGLLPGGGAGGAGGTAGAGVKGANAPTQPYGGAGGHGGAGSSTAGGTGGAATATSAANGGVVMARVLPSAATGSFVTGAAVYAMAGGAGGGGGGGDGTHPGGGGGGGGGTLIVLAKAVTGTLTFQSNGGVGFTPAAGDVGGGGGGGGGLVIVNCTSADGQTVQARGGASAPGLGTGTAGAAGLAGRTFLNIFS